MNRMINIPGSQPSNRPADTLGVAKSFSLVDIKQYFHIVVKRIWLVALCFIVSLTVMVVMLVREIPSYQATTTLLLSKGLPIPQKIRQEETELLGDYLATQQRIIQSSELIGRAKQRINMSQAEISQKYKGVSVYPIGKTSFIGITVSGLDPVFCADFANALAEEYLDFKNEERLETSQNTVVSLTQQAARLHEELKKAEVETLTFIKENRVVGIEERGNIAASILGSLASQAAQYRNQRMLLEVQQPLLAQASDDAVLVALGSVFPYSPGIQGDQSSLATNSLLTASRGPESLIDYGAVNPASWPSLKRQNAILKAKLTALSKKFKDAHPQIQQIRQTLQDNEQTIEIELQFALNGYYSQLEALTIKEQAAKRVEQEWEDQALEVSKKLQEFGNLKRNAARLQSLYDLIFNRLKEIDISVGIEPESERIMERAKPNFNPIAPRKIQSLFLAALIGLGLGLGLVFGLEYIDDSVRYPEEVTKLLGLPFLGVVPAANWDPDDLHAHLLANIDQKSGLAEAYRNVRSALMLGQTKDSLKTLVVTSAVPKEGKTTTCLNLAISLAQAGSRVLMVDADLRRGELHKFFGLDGGKGFSDLLMGQAKPESVIQRTGIPNLELIPTGPFPSNPAEIILRPEMNSFLEYARKMYDRILFDCPPVMAVSEAAIMAAMMDGSLMVVWAGRTSRKLAQLTLQVLRERGANMLGCILNNLEFGRVGYYYYSTYYGYYNYDYYYGKPESRKRS